MNTRLVLALYLFSSAGPLVHAQSAAQPMSDTISGTWFGEFVVTGPDGKVSHDTAVLMIDRHGSTVSGSIGRTVDQQSTFRDGVLKDNRISFHLDAGGGMAFVLDIQRGRLAGTATGASMKAQIDLRPAPGLLPQKTLTAEITSAEDQLYEAFGRCDVTQYSRFISKDLEFYHDRTGKTNYDENLAAMRSRCAEGIRLRREVDKDSLIIEAIEAGVHRFFSQNADGSERLDATARFTNVWSKETGMWKLVRVISYDHR
jgi:ketosteroid isomerase-like protein